MGIYIFQYIFFMNEDFFFDLVWEIEDQIRKTMINRDEVLGKD